METSTHCFISQEQCNFASDLYGLYNGSSVIVLSNTMNDHKGFLDNIE